MHTKFAQEQAINSLLRARVLLVRSIMEIKLSSMSCRGILGDINIRFLKTDRNNLKAWAL